MRYITLTVSPALDVTYKDCSELKVSGTNRVKKGVITAGGKGINLSRALLSLGEERVETLFFCNRDSSDGALLCSLLSDMPHTAIPYSDANINTRRCIKHLSDKGVLTEINEECAPIGEGEMMILAEYLADLIAVPEDTVFLLCGSIPQPVEIPVYNLVIKLMKSCGITCVLDSSGIGLSDGLEGRPSLIKPNLEELCALAGRQLDFESGAVEYCSELFHRYGCEVLLTNGGKGALYVGRQGVVRARPIDTPHNLSTGSVGCGDIFLACFVRAYYSQNLSAAKALKFAVSCSALGARQYEKFSRAQIDDELLKNASNYPVSIEKL